MVEELGCGIVITGSIGTGKSSITQRLRADGLAIIDADLISKEQFELLSDEIAKSFGQEILVNGQIDRKKLAAVVFSDKEKRERLEAILHPAIRSEIMRRSLLLEAKKECYVVDIPLFYETNAYNYKNVVVVYADKKQQLERIQKRDKLSEELALKRIASQMDIEKKRSLADYVIDNSGTPEALAKEYEIFKQSYLRSRCESC